MFKILYWCKYNIQTVHRFPRQCVLHTTKYKGTDASVPHPATSTRLDCRDIPPGIQFERLDNPTVCRTTLIEGIEEYSSRHK